jgi:hypothetical protein
MDMAALNGGDLRRLLVSAEFFSNLAIFLGSFQVNTPVPGPGHYFPASP